LGDSFHKRDNHSSVCSVKQGIANAGTTTTNIMASQQQQQQQQKCSMMHASLKHCHHQRRLVVIVGRDVQCVPTEINFSNCQCFSKCPNEIKFSNCQCFSKCPQHFPSGGLVLSLIVVVIVVVVDQRSTRYAQRHIVACFGFWVMCGIVGFPVKWHSVSSQHFLLHVLVSG
jgi:hypothetical protein